MTNDPLAIMPEGAKPVHVDRSGEFQKELEQLINRFSMENASNTPDYILAHYLMGCLTAFNTAMGDRSRWYTPTNK